MLSLLNQLQCPVTRLTLTFSFLNPQALLYACSHPQYMCLKFKKAKHNTGDTILKPGRGIDVSTLNMSEGELFAAFEGFLRNTQGPCLTYAQACNLPCIVTLN